MMNIIITLAGHSRRFQAAGYDVPKFLIPIDGKTMVEHVIDMFDERDFYHFVLNEEQVARYPHIPDWLSRLTCRNSVTIIPVHEHGPVYSALQVKGIAEEAPTLISYCDLFVEWNYARFKREIVGYSGAIPAFRGFHPASFGDTYYAYMRSDEAGHLLELREKQSFTDQRHEEFASAGIYYFESWKIYRHYAERLMKEGFQGLKEGYVSLLANLMIADGLRIKVTEVDKFICWGTPEDLEQYLFWSTYFLQNNPRPRRLVPPDAQNRQVNMVPMAGKGSRFRRASYNISKPLIAVGSQPMAVAACQSFPAADAWVFLPRAEDMEKHPVREVLDRHFSGASFFPVDHDTSGQAATCLLGKSALRPDDHLLIASCDYQTIYNSEAWQSILDDSSIDAAIWTCRLGAVLTKNPKAFAYCVVGADGKTVTRIVEKDTISDTPGKDPLVVGTFWFRRADDFVQTAEKAIHLNMNVNGEHYVANSMNLMLAEGKRIVIFDIEQWISFGDPLELDVYYYWEEFFYARTKNNRGRASA